MSGSNSRRPPLVADKRPSKSKKTSATRKTTGSRRKAAPARRRSRNPLVWLVSSVFRLIWGIGWRVTALVALAVAGAVLFYAATLPPVGNLLDARARGSVTLLDRDGQVFAWRGEQFGGQITADTVSPHLKNAVVATEDKR